MRKFNVIFNYLIILLIGFLITVLFDYQQSNSYISLNGRKGKAIELNDEIANISEDKLATIYEIAIRDNVIMTKERYDQEPKVIITYVVTDSLRDIFPNHLITIKENIKGGFISTYKTTDSNCKYYLPDFLNNNRYEFHSYKEMERDGIYAFGKYMVYYNDYDDFNQFISDVSELLGLKPEELVLEISGVIMKETSWLYGGIIGIIGLFIIFYFLISIYNLYRDSKVIGCLILLGYKDKDILRNINKKELIIYFVIWFALSIIVSIIVPNATIEYFLVLILLVTVMSIITKLINYLSLKYVAKKMNISNLIKKESLIKGISNLCLGLKGIVMFLMIIFMVYSLPQLQQYLSIVKHAKENAYLNDYAVFKTINEESEQSSDTDNQLLLFQELNDSDIDYLYVNFSDYQHPKEYENVDQQEASGSFYRIASVDKNYLDKYPVKIIGEQITYKSGEYYLIPQSKKDYVEGLKVKIEKRYSRLGINQTFQYLIYEDRKFDTYDSDNDVSKVSSPLLRVIDTYYPLNYIDTPTGLSIAGIGMTTGLKIDISKGKKEIYNELLPILKSCNLEEALTFNNFVGYQEYFNDNELKLFNIQRLIIIVSISISMIVVLLVTMTFSLYLEARRNEMIVKESMGFKRGDILKIIFVENIIMTIIPTIGIYIYMAIHNFYSLNLLGLFSGILLIGEIVTDLLIIKLISFKDITEQLKGGD